MQPVVVRWRPRSFQVVSTVEGSRGDPQRCRFQPIHSMAIWARWWPFNYVLGGPFNHPQQIGWFSPNLVIFLDNFFFEHFLAELSDFQFWQLAPIFWVFFSNLNWEVCQFSRHKFGWFWPKLVFFFGRVINSRFWNFRLIFKNPIFWLFYFPNAQFMVKFANFPAIHLAGFDQNWLILAKLLASDFGILGQFLTISEWFWMKLADFSWFSSIFPNYIRKFADIGQFWPILTSEFF